MLKLTGPIIGLRFLGHNRVVVGSTYGLIHFTYLKMQVKSANSEKITKPQPILKDDKLTIPLMTTKTKNVFVDHPSEWETTGSVTPFERFIGTASLLISHSMSTKIENVAVRVTNTNKSSYTIRKNTQIAEFPVVTPEQSKFIQPAETAVLNMLNEGDTDLNTCLNELLRAIKEEHQSNTFWFPTSQSPG